MNIQHLSLPKVQQWIQQHKKENVYSLALRKSPFPGIEMSDLVTQIQGWQTAKHKFKLIFKDHPIIFPPKINLEQTSSVLTAQYKSNIIQGRLIIDITGGFGIDSLYFSESFKEVYHIEQNHNLQEIAKYNFNLLGKKNIQSFCGDGIEFLNQNQHLDDILFIDPARRNENQQKVFLLEDLTPNILKHIHKWIPKFNEIWVKLSPMIDIQYLIKVIPNISHIHLVAVKNELKEVLIQVKKQQEYKITALNLDTKQPNIIFDWNRRSFNSTYSNIQKYIYEPNVAIQKSRMIDSLAEFYDVKKLHPNSQLFTSNDLLNDFPGRIFKIHSTIKNPKKELKNKSIQAIHRNFPNSLSNLKKKYKFKTDGTQPIIFTQTQDNVLILKTENVKI